MPTPDEFVRALRNERAYAGDHPILGRAPIVAPPVLGPADAWRALGSPDPLNVVNTLHSASPMEAAQNTVQGLMNMVGPLPVKAAGVGAAAALPALVRYGSAAAERTAPFYSAAEKAIGEAGLSKAPLSQWLATLRNKGVKEEELNWLGLGKAPVGDTPGWAGHVTKDQLSDWVKGHGVQLQEVQRGNVEPTVTDLDKLAQATYRRNYDQLDPTRQEGLYHDWHKDAGMAGGTKFSQYQLPGGTNYRETLLTLPPYGEGVGGRLEAINNRLREITEMPADRGASADQLTKEFDDLRAEQAQLRNSNPQRSPFTGSHWDEPNVLAHVRHNDRMLPPSEAGGDPRKALFLEEVQSDWHQRGRKQGYQNNNEVMPKSSEEFLGQARTPEEESADFQNRRLDSRVPDAPFKQSWPDLALKRMLAKAAHEGYDALAWTPGDVQAARYDLSKQAKAIDWLKHQDGTYGIAVTDLNGATHDIGHGYSPEKLSDLVGKEAAEKIVNAEGRDVTLGGQPFKGGTLEGVDLKVGGEGMRAFYDKMLVDKANALGKRYGAKVQQEPLDAGVESFSMRNPEGQHFFGGPTAEAARQRLEDAGIAGVDKMEPVDNRKVVHVLPITPELRAAAQKGFPLFATGGVAALGAAAPGGQQPDQPKAPDDNERMLNALRGNNPGAL